MHYLREKFKSSPIYVRVAPFVIFLALTFSPMLLQGLASLLGSFQVEAPALVWAAEHARYWMYLVKTLVGAWLVWEMRLYVAEMRWAISWEAVVVGVGVCVMWIGIYDWYPKFSKAGTPWNPHALYGEGSAMAWMFVVVHLLGSTFVVPPLEEVFYRSFLYRYFVKTDFLAMPLSRFHLLSFVVTAFIFGALEHYEWLSGILCGLAFQWLVLRKNRLGDAMTAHAITNFLLGLWVIWKLDWKFW